MRKITQDAETREKILLGTIDVFNEKGLKFTMDDLAANLHMSKKTIYQLYKDKEEMFLDMVEFIFARIKETEREILENPNLSTCQRIRMLLGAMPESYKDVDFQKLSSLREKYPAIYKEVAIRLETGWEPTIELLKQGVQEGLLRDVNLAIVKMMLEASLEKFFQSDVLVDNGITYMEALDSVVDIILQGIMA